MQKITFIYFFTLLSFNAFSQWELIDIYYHDDVFNDVFFANSSIGYAVGWSGRIIKTTDSGKTWDSLSSGANNDLSAVQFINSDTGFVAGGGIDGVILKTVNGGKTWENSLLYISPPESISHFFGIYFTDSNTGYAVGYSMTFFEGTFKEKGVIYKTMNGGNTWDSSNVVIPYNLNSIYFPSANIGYTVGDKGLILKTINKGDTWENISYNSNQTFISVFFTNDETGYIVGDSGVILKTINGGKSWESLSIKTKSNFHSIYFTDENTGYIVGGDSVNFKGIILKTNDAGLSWSIYSNNIPFSLHSVFFLHSNIGYAVGASGFIYKTTNAGGTTAIQESSSQPSTFNFYPNPVNDELTVSYTLEKTSTVQIRLLDIIGAVKQTIDIENQAQGDYIREIPMNSMPVGFYLLQVRINGSTKIEKLVKM